MKKIVMTASIFLSALYANDASIMLPEIEIVSSKTYQSNIDIPKSIQTLSTEKLEIYNADSLNNFSGSISNTNISGLGGRSEATVSIRGISNYTTYESSASVYVDDAPLPFSYGFGAINFQDVKRIEVLKGPQGTLYGRSSESGVINIYTPSPTKEFKSSVKLGVGEYNSKNIYGVVSGPINSEFSYMFSAYKNERDGFTTNTYFDKDLDYRDTKGFNLKLSYTPSSNLSFDFKYSKDMLDDGGSPLKFNTKENPYSISEPYKTYMKMDADITSVKIKYLQGDYTLTSISSYSKEDMKDSKYIALSNAILINRDIQIEEFSQELRLNYDASDDLEVTFGAFYSNKFRFDYDDKVILFANSSELYNWDMNLPDTSYALFSQLEYLLTSDLVLTAGIRYEETKRNYKRDFIYLGTSAGYADVSKTFSQVLPKLALSYYLHNDSQIYLSYSEGYRTGGYNYRSSSSNPLPYKEESTQSYELGYKNSINNSLFISSALFYNFIKDLRVNTFADNLSAIVINADKAETYGVEFDISYKPNKKLYLFSNFGLTNAKMKKLSGLDAQYENNNVIDVPDFTASVGGKYFFKNNLYLQSDFRYVGERYYNVSNSVKESGYKIFNVGFGYENNGLKALLYANNLFEEEYVDYMIATPSNNYYHFGQPRMIGVSFSKSF